MPKVLELFLCLAMQLFPYIQTVSFMVSKSSQSMNLYKSKFSVLRSFSMSKHYKHIPVIEQAKNCPTPQEKKQQCWCVCVVNCVLIKLYGALL